MEGKWEKKIKRKKIKKKERSIKRASGQLKCVQLNSSIEQLNLFYLVVQKYQAVIVGRSMIEAW